MDVVIWSYICAILNSTLMIAIRKGVFRGNLLPIVRFRKDICAIMHVLRNMSGAGLLVQLSALELMMGACTLGAYASFQTISTGVTTRGRVDL